MQSNGAMEQAEGDEVLMKILINHRSLEGTPKEILAELVADDHSAESPRNHKMNVRARLELLGYNPEKVPVHSPSMYLEALERLGFIRILERN